MARGKGGQLYDADDLDYDEDDWDEDWEDEQPKAKPQVGRMQVAFGPSSVKLCSRCWVGICHVVRLCMRD